MHGKELCHGRFFWNVSVASGVLESMCSAIVSMGDCGGYQKSLSADFQAPLTPCTDQLASCICKKKFKYKSTKEQRNKITKVQEYKIHFVWSRNQFELQCIVSVVGKDFWPKIAPGKGFTIPTSNTSSIIYRIPQNSFNFSLYFYRVFLLTGPEVLLVQVLSCRITQKSYDFFRERSLYFLTPEMFPARGPLICMKYLLNHAIEKNQFFGQKSIQHYKDLLFVILKLETAGSLSLSNDKLFQLCHP